MSPKGSDEAPGRVGCRVAPPDETGWWTERAVARWPLRPLPDQSTLSSWLSHVTGLGVGSPASNPQHVRALSPQVRMALLRIIGQLALSGFQDRIRGWGLKYVSVQLTLSTYKLVSGPAMQMVKQLDSGNGFHSVEESVLLSVPGFEPACVYLHDARTQTHTVSRRSLENTETCAQLWASQRLSIWASSLVGGEETAAKTTTSPCQPTGRGPSSLSSRYIAGGAFIRGAWRRRWSTRSPWAP